jgi:hypothetical protein
LGTSVLERSMVADMGEEQFFQGMAETLDRGT